MRILSFVLLCACATLVRDALGNVTSRATPSGLTCNARYLNAGRISSDWVAGGSLTTHSNSYEYYATGQAWAGLLQTATDGRGTTRTCTYDDYRRLTSLSTSGSAAEQQTSTTYQHDRRGLLTSLSQSFNSTNTGPATAISHSFDSYAQLVSEAISIGSGGVYQAGQSWDAAGRRSQLNFGLEDLGFSYRPDGLMSAADGCTFGYGDNGLLTGRTNSSRVYLVSQRDGVGRVLQALTKVLFSTNLTENLTWRNDGRLSAYTAIRSGDFTDARNYAYAPYSQRLTQEVFNVSASLKYTNNYTFDNGLAGRLGVLTAISTPAQATNTWSAPSTGGLDGLNRIAWEQTAITRRPATGLALGAATVSATLDSNPVGVEFDGTDANGRWRANLDLVPGSHTLKLSAVHPSGQYTAYATNTFNATGSADTVTNQFDGNGNVTKRTWLSSNGQTNRTQTFTWDAFDRLIKISERDSVGSGQDWVGIYDGLGRKVRTTTTLVVSNTPITSPADAVSTVDSWFDPQVEFLEIGTVVNGGVPTLKVYGPDASGAYGGLGCVGGLERLEIFGHANQVGLVQDFFGNVIGTITNNIVAWNPARFSSYGPVPGYQSPALTLDTTLAQSLGWRGKHIEAIGTFHWGARPYEPASGRFLTHDPVFDPANPSGFSVCGGDMLNSFDADGRFGKQSGGLEFPFSEYARNAEHEALLDDLYGPKVTTADILVGLVNFGESVLSLPFSIAEGIGSDIDTATSGTYVNEYGVTLEASTGRRIWAGAMAALTLLPMSDFAEGGIQAYRGLGTLGRGLDAAEDFRYAFSGAPDAEGGLFSATTGPGMESGLFQRIQTAFERQPGRVMLADQNSALELDRLSRPGMTVEGRTYNENVIFLRPNPSASSVYEELIHTAQIRRGMDPETQWLEMEIEAQQKLIRFADQYNIPASETQQTISRLNELLQRKP